MTVKISSLPERLTDQEASALAYRAEYEDLITGVFDHRKNTLVTCDKEMVNLVFTHLRSHNRSLASDEKLNIQFLDGRPAAADEPSMGPPPTMMQVIMAALKEIIYSESARTLVVLPHLDMLATTTSAGLTQDARELFALLHTNPNVCFVAFKDPTLALPEALEKAFISKIRIGGISRDALPRIILQCEARKLGVEDFNPYALYKYVSGMNVVAFRAIMRSYHNRIDFSESVPMTREAIYRDIRKNTVASDVDLPNVDLDKDIGGYEDVKKQLKEEILDLLAMKDTLTEDDQIRAIEDLIPRGMIFYGPPGTGKTFFAKAMATALNATVHIVSGPELKSKWVGESEERLREVFDKARKSAPSIIIFDELDSFASARGTYTGSGVEHSMVNQMLTEMDGFRKEDLVFVVGTTNFPSSLDQALLRPGRFELLVPIDYPDDDARRAIIQIYTKKLKLELEEGVEDYLVDLTGTPVDRARRVMHSGDHITAKMKAIKRDVIRRTAKTFKKEQVVSKADVDLQFPKIKLTLSPEERKVVAFHESGHALLSAMLQGTPPISKVTIASDHEGALGYVLHDIEENKHIHSESGLRDRICMGYGGRAAEILIFGTASEGCGQDLIQATAIATYMVERCGMGESCGPRAFRLPKETMRGIVQDREISPETAHMIDMDVSKILDFEMRRALKILTENKSALTEIAETLLNEKETLTGDEVKAIVSKFESTTLNLLD